MAKLYPSFSLKYMYVNFFTVINKSYKVQIIEMHNIGMTILRKSRLQIEESATEKSCRTNETSYIKRFNYVHCDMRI